MRSIIVCFLLFGFHSSAQQKSKTVLLDYYFNNEWKKNDKGENVRYHYTWEDTTNSGFSILGELFRKQGARTVSLESAPTTTNLRSCDVYIIVDPDTEKETANPNYIQQAHIDAIRQFVKDGGVLVMMSNDSANAEFEHFNQLAKEFGIMFKQVCTNKVQNDNFEQGAIYIGKENSVFTHPSKIFLKDVSDISVRSRARIVVRKGSDNIMAIAKYGKGTVFAVGDPWLYNEYIGHRRLPADFQNYEAATDLVKWLLRQTGKSSKL